MTGKSRSDRVIGRVLRVPAALDRGGTRWLLGAVSPAPVIVLVHRGRVSGKVYKTPVEVLAGDTDGGEFVISPMFGRDSDWYRNLVAGHLVEVHIGDRVRQVEWRELPEPERRTAVDAYREAHPRYSRLILRMLASVNDFEGDPEEAILREHPMIGLREKD